MNTLHTGSLRGRRGGIATFAMVGIVVATVAVAATSTSLSTSRRRRPDPPPMSLVELEVALRRNQLTPQALAAAGLSGPDTTALIGRASQELTPAIVDLRTAVDQLGAARIAKDGLERTVRAGLGGEQGGSTLATAAATLTSKEANLTTQLTAVRTAAFGQSFPGGPAAALGNIQANSAWAMPIEYLCRAPGEVTEAQWVALRDALADQRIAAREGGSPSQASQAVLDAWAADPAVSAAKSNLQSGLAAVTTAWNAALHP